MVQKSKEVLKRELEALEDLAIKIESKATGYELAYEVERNKNLPRLYSNGIHFIETFKQIGSQVFLESPDKVIKVFTTFKTKDDSEKTIFLKWLNKEIEERKETLYPRSDYLKYKEMMEQQEKVGEMGNCPYCGALINDKTQKFCEECGMKLI